MPMGAKKEEEEPITVLIAGAGIGGLCLALALKQHCGLKGSEIVVYEQATAFTDSAGGAMGLYANGLRVLRDISPALLAAVRSEGYDYLYRRWMRHDGTEVACAREDALVADPELQSLGIRRWRLQKVLMDATTAAGIAVHFKKRTERVEPRADGTVHVAFADGAERVAKMVIGADGLKSKVRNAVVGELAADFTGVTCLMGAAKVPRPVRGICFPSSSTTKNHACYYPSGNAAPRRASNRPIDCADAFAASHVRASRVRCPLSHPARPRRVQATMRRSSRSTSPPRRSRRTGARSRPTRGGGSAPSSPRSWGATAGTRACSRRCARRRRSSASASLRARPSTRGAPRMMVNVAVLAVPDLDDAGS